MILTYQNFLNEMYFGPKLDITKRPKKERAQEKFRIKNDRGTFYMSVLGKQDFYDGTSLLPNKTSTVYRVGFRAPLVINSCTFSPALELKVHHFPETKTVEVSECRGMWDRVCYHQLGFIRPYRGLELYLGFLYEDNIKGISIGGVEDMRSHDPWQYWLAFCTGLRFPPYNDLDIRLDLDGQGNITPDDGLMFLARMMKQSITKSQNAHRENRAPYVTDATGQRIKLWTIAHEINNVLRKDDRDALQEYMLQVFPSKSRCLGYEGGEAAAVDALTSF